VHALQVDGNFSILLFTKELMMKMQALITALVFAVSGTAFAQTSQTARDPAATPRLDQRQANQEKRIEQGVASGQLTEKEAARMESVPSRPRWVRRRHTPGGPTGRQSLPAPLVHKAGAARSSASSGRALDTTGT
jgi:hypothetical protein